MVFMVKAQLARPCASFSLVIEHGISKRLKKKGLDLQGNLGSEQRQGRLPIAQLMENLALVREDHGERLA